MTLDSTPLPVSKIVGHPYEPEVAEIVAAIRQDREPRATVVDGARAVAVAVAIQQSIVEHGPVAVEQF